MSNIPGCRVSDPTNIVLARCTSSRPVLVVFVLKYNGPRREISLHCASRTHRGPGKAAVGGSIATATLDKDYLGSQVLAQ